MKVGKVIRNVLIALVTLVLLVLVALQVLLRPQVLTGIVNSLAADYVEGDVNFREVRAHVIKSFPFLTVDAQDFSITYPHERYARYDTLYPVDTRRRFSLLKAGWQKEMPGQAGHDEKVAGHDEKVTGHDEEVAGHDAMDTLAAFRQLSVSLNYMALLNKNVIHVHKLELQRPRIFAHYYDSTAANWDILPIGKSQDTTSSPLPPIVVNKISLTDRPFIVFTNPADTLHGMFTMRRLTLDGKVETEQLFRSDVQVSIDSLMVSGRLPADTVSLRLQRLRGSAKERHFTLDADAQASLRTNSYGRLRIPIHLDADAQLPEHEDGELEAIVNSLHLSLSSINLEGKGQVFLHGDGITDLDVSAAIKKAPLGKLAKEFEDNIPILKKLSTNAVLSLNAQAKGSYGQGKMPAVNARVQIPTAWLDYEGLGRRGRLALDASVTTSDLKQVNGVVKQLYIDIVGAQADASGSIKDILGKDPAITLDGTLKARVDSLTRAFTREIGISGTGSVDARISGKARLSQLNLAKIANTNLSCELQARDLDIQDTRDSLTALVPQLGLSLETKANQIDRFLPQGARVLALKADMDTLNVTLKDMFIRGGKLQLLAQNSADILKGGEDLTSLMGILKAGSLRLRDADGMGVSLRDNTEAFRIEPANESRPTPKFTLRSKSSRLRARLDANLVGLRDFSFDLSATRHIRRSVNTARMDHMLDSLQRIYPGIPRDSLFRHARLARLERESRDAFAAKDVKISLSQALQDYVRNWDFEGNVGLESGRLMLPAFPLRTSVSAIKGSFDNDTLDLRNITVQAGESDLSARAKLTGIRRSILGRGHSLLKLKADVTSNYIDANELMRAYAYYTTYQPADSLSAASDEAVEAAIGQADLPDSSASRLLVIPSNLEVAFTLEASGIKYDSLLVSWAAADVAMRQRTLQVTNALAASNMGDIYFEGFYTTRSKEDIKAGFDLNLVNITAEKVITLFPAIDTLMPLLTTFAGDLDCELAATTDIDTLMNVILPSVDGIMKISGKDLGLNESPELTKVAKLLKFNNQKEAHIDNMSVTGIVQNNILEIFPFVLDVDRYQLAASGTQHLSQEFDYHVSVIKSPMILKFGLNAWGPDFDHIHYSLGKAKYRSANVPVYTKELNAVQYNLIGAIHNIFEAGVEKALAENRTGAYFGQVSVGETPESEEFPDEALQDMEVFLADVLEQTATRREALKEEVLRLEKEAAKKNE